MKKQFKKGDFSDLTTEDLIKKKKSTSFVTGLLAGALIGLFMTAIFQSTNKGFTPLLVIPFASLPILIMIYSQVRSMNKELKRRKLNL